MPFNSFSYPLFLAAACVIFWVAPFSLRAFVLIVAGILYYVSYDAHSFLLIAGLALVTYAVGLFIRQSEGPKRMSVAAAVALIVLVLVFFKYLGLFSSAALSIFHLQSQTPTILLPLGISFFTFEFIHYLADTYYRKIGSHRARDFFAFAFFFPTLISGPIKRFEAFHESLAENRWQSNMFFSGVCYLLLGYAQKYMLADPLIPFTTLLAHPSALPTTASALGGLFFYSFRIYFDFAGLSNIAIGSAMLFGIIVPQNFANPYVSGNIQEFWRRWHMSLSSWVRDYIYILLGGSRRGLLVTSLNLLLVMTVVGLWHGSSWNFAVWGIYHGCGLAVHRLWKAAGFSLGTSWPARILGILITFAFVTVGWAFFATTSLSDSFVLLSKAFPFF